MGIVWVMSSSASFFKAVVLPAGWKWKGGGAGVGIKRAALARPQSDKSAVAPYPSYRDQGPKYVPASQRMKFCN